MIHFAITAHRAFAIVAAGVLLLSAAACVGGPGSSGAPGSGVPGSGTPTATPSSPPPTRKPTPAPTSGGCGVATWSHGTTDLVLRMTVAGGLMAPGVERLTLPAISVYGDGRVIVPGAQIMIYPGPLLPALAEQHLTEAGIRRLLDAAAAAGLLVPDTTYPAQGIADAPTTFFTLNADGCAHHVNAYALIDSISTAGLDQATIDARAKLLAFAAALNDLRTLAGTGNLDGSGLYQPGGYRIITRPEPAGTSAAGGPVGVVTWPLAVPLSAYGDALNAGQPDPRCAAVLGADAQTLRPLFQAANTETHWRSGGSTYVLRVRPLLPDETGCSDPIV